MNAFADGAISEEESEAIMDKWAEVNDQEQLENEYKELRRKFAARARGEQDEMDNSTM